MISTDNKTIKNTSYNYSLEGLRGICAITVAFSHIQGNKILVKDFNTLLSYLNFNHIAVLIFFVLSGYVIGVNYPLNNFEVKDYLKKRLIRLYPIYIIIVVFCMLIEPNLDLKLVFSQVFLLQNILPTFTTNVVLWSINYEIVFYVIFLILPHHLKSIKLILIACAIISFVAYLNPTIPSVLGGYLSGICFWIAGLYLSKIKEVNSSLKIKPIFSLFICAVLYNQLVPGIVLLNGVGLKSLSQLSIVSFADLVTLPFCLLFVIEAGNLKVKNHLLNFLYCFTFIIPLLILVFIVYKGRLNESLRWEVCSVLFLLSSLTYFIKQQTDFLSKAAYWGSLSYAIYIIHYPIGYYLGSIYQASGIFEDIIIILIWGIITFVLSYLLEKEIQPGIKKRYYPSLENKTLIS